MELSIYYLNSAKVFCAMISPRSMAITLENLAVCFTTLCGFWSDITYFFLVFGAWKQLYVGRHSHTLRQLWFCLPPRPVAMHNSSSYIVPRSRFCVIGPRARDSLGHRRRILWGEWKRNCSSHNASNLSKRLSQVALRAKAIAWQPYWKPTDFGEADMTSLDPTLKF